MKVHYWVVRIPEVIIWCDQPIKYSVSAYKSMCNFMGESSKFPKSLTKEIQILKLVGCLQK